MQSIKLLVLDLERTCKLGSSLASVLLNSGMAAPPVSHEAMSLSNCMSPDFKIIPFLSAMLPDVIFLVLPPAPLNDLEALFKILKDQVPDVPLIAVVESYSQEQMTALLRRGAADLLSPPFKDHDIESCLERWGSPRNNQEKLVLSLKEKIGLRQLVGESPAFLSEVKKIPLMARCDAGVLISGETGTGKELCARAIHYLSPRTGHPFIPVNCGAIPVDLVENELFGHVQGAFTGATSLALGLIEEAKKGTLFLDEIDCLPLQAQVKLLRFLQDKEYKMLGCTKMRRSDVRVIAASNINLEKTVSEGKFRRDLFYRLNIIPLKLPLLKDRQEDIPLLATHFLEKYTLEFDKPAKDFSPEALQKLMVYEWPGNVRELENVVERAVIFSLQPSILERDVILPQTETSFKKESLKQAKSRVIAQFEKSYIKGLLIAHQGNISRAAKAAQKNRRAFWELVRKYKIDVPSMKSYPQQTDI